MAKYTAQRKSWDMARHVRRLLKAPGERFSDIEYAVLEQLAFHWNQEARRSWPSVETIAWYVDREPRSVQRVVRELEALKIIACIGYDRGGRKGKTGLARRYALRILDWPHTKPERNLRRHLDVTADTELGRHSDVTVGEEARVTSGDVRVTSESPYGDILGTVDGTLGRHLGVTRTGKRTESSPVSLEETGLRTESEQRAGAGANGRGAPVASLPALPEPEPQADKEEAARISRTEFRAWDCWRIANLPKDEQEAEIAHIDYKAGWKSPVYIQHSIDLQAAFLAWKAEREQKRSEAI